MDPRHPELAVSRIKELIAQYDRIEKDIASATIANKLGQLEREGGLVIQEICLVAPRLHEAMMQASRQRRHQLSMGITYVPEEKVGKYIKATIGIKEEPEEVYVAPNQAETVIVEPKPRKKKKTTKKKKVEE